MKLIFVKNEELEISVASQSGDDRAEFNYINMINALIEHRQLESPEFEGEFTDAEKNSVKTMVSHINNEVANFYSDEENQK